MRRRACLLLPCLLALLAWPAAAPAQQLLTGFSDQSTFSNADPAVRQLSLRRAKEARASIIRTEISWGGVSRTEPPTPQAAVDPSWMGYDWAGTDAHVRDVVAAGLQPFLLINGAPRWAEGPDRPPVSEDAPNGSWRPDAGAYGRFAEAAARRYSGTTPDPLNPGATLPRVKDWQAWNEPNLTNFITPQWRRTNNGIAPESPEIYRPMLNAFYAGVKRVDPSNVVVTAGTAPFGDLHRGDRRMQPAMFTRALLCVRGRARPKPFKRCPGGPVHFDVLAHHPYPIGSPHRTALNADDVNIPDIGKLTGPLRVATRAGFVSPRNAKPVWATEFSWDSKPPDPEAISTALQARYLAGSLYVLWRQGVDVAIWYLMRDEAPDPSYDKSLQAGVFFRGKTLEDDRPKPSYTAFRFPFAAYIEKGIARAWGIAPVDGAVTLQARHDGKWRTLATVQPGAGRVFKHRLHVGKGTPLRALAGDERSLTWIAAPPLVGL
jgi:hypothetical protein